MTRADMPLRQFGPILFAALSYDVVFVLFILPIARRPQKQLDLLRSGRATRGKITGKTPGKSESANGTISYWFEATPAGTGVTEHTGTMTVSRADYDSISENDWVTVVYSLKKPGISTVYEMCDFEEEDEDISDFVNAQKSPPVDMPKPVAADSARKPKSEPTRR